MSKPKISDIAREAGVSCATVSYVLNNNPHQKINENTKKKILQIASLLGYTKNVYASALASGKTNMIGLYTKSSDFALKNAWNYSFIEKLTIALKKEGYTLVLLSNDYTENINFVDSILTFDLSEEDFISICNNVYIPVIAIDTKPHEDWIFAVATTYKNTIQDSLLVEFKGNSNYVNQEILKNNPNTILVSTYAELTKLKYENKNIVTYNSVLHSYLTSIDANSRLLENNNEAKLEKIIEFLKNAQEHKNKATHLFQI